MISTSIRRHSVECLDTFGGREDRVLPECLLLFSPPPRESSGLSWGGGQISTHKKKNLAAFSLTALPDACHHHKDTVLVWQLLLREILVDLGKMGLNKVKEYRVRFKKTRVKVVWVRKALKPLAYLCDPSCLEK